MKIYLYFISFVLSYYRIGGVQPYFPPQIVFSPNNETIVAIDEINQRAFISVHQTPYNYQTFYAMSRFPYARPKSPQSKYDVQLVVYNPWFVCNYATYWKYAKNTFNLFPDHWLNGSSFHIRNYINFNTTMIRSNTSRNEDYWYSSDTCEVDPITHVPCEEIYFRKNTDIPLRSTKVIYQRLRNLQITTVYNIISIGKPNNKYFESIPKNWSTACTDTDLGLVLSDENPTIKLNKSVKIRFWLATPPHQVNGNDKVTIDWRTSYATDAITWTPKEFTFNGKNFQKPQILTITRVQDSPAITLGPFFRGGGYDNVPVNPYSLFIR